MMSLSTVFNVLSMAWTLFGDETVLAIPGFLYAEAAKAVAGNEELLLLIGECVLLACVFAGTGWAVASLTVKFALAKKEGVVPMTLELALALPQLKTACRDVVEETQAVNVAAAVGGDGVSSAASKHI